MQEERIKTYKLFKEGNKRILVATDLVGRGIDIERVNIVINYDMPETDEKKGNGADTYLHRVSICVKIQHIIILLIFPLNSCCVLIETLHPLSSILRRALCHQQVGRAGRFGTKGLAITFCSSEADTPVLSNVQDRFDVDIKALPDKIESRSVALRAVHVLPYLTCMAVRYSFAKKCSYCLML